MRKISLLFGLLAGMTGAGFGAEPIRLDWGDLDTSGAAQQQAVRALRGASRPATMQRLSGEGMASWLVQFDGVIQAEWRAALEAAGARIKGYMPENGFLFRAAPEDIPAIAALEHVTWVGEFLPEYKRAAQVRARLAKVKSGAESDAARAHRVLLFSEDDLRAVAARMEALTGRAVAVAAGELIQADLTTAQIEEVTRWGEVQWVEVYTRPRLWNNVAVGTNMMDVGRAWSDLGLTGAGQTVAVCDTGLDTGNTNTIHQDFTGRVMGFGWKDGVYLSSYSWADENSHGTHVAGSVLGSGAMSAGLYRGAAYEADLIVQGTQTDLNGIPSTLATLFRQAFMNGARIHSDSWGYEDTSGDYIAQSLAVDQFVWSNKTFLIVIAAGNEGVDANSDGVIDWGSVGAPATAKNCLTVGAAETYRTSGGYAGRTWGGTWPSDYPASPIKGDYISRPLSNGIQGMAAFSSRGPCNDGRIKPDLVAPGTDIISTRSRMATGTGWGTLSNTNYIYMGGTSMATPLTAGAAALTRQWLMSTGGVANPSAALIKALMINGARDMTPGQYGTGAQQEIRGRPDNAQGWGHVDLFNTLKPATNQFLDLYDTNSLATGRSNIFAYTVSTISTSRFYVTLAYSDYWGTAGAGKQLVNDLDVTVRKPSGSYLYANGRTSEDATNNVEMIEFEANEVGTYAVVVSARTVPSGGSQPYALVVRGPKDVPSAPTFGENPGPVEAVVGQMAEFEVTASGYPIPVVQLQSTTASANSYDVDAGYCVYEPPWEDIGTQTFMFTASNSLGVATQVVSVYVTEAAPDAPASVWASATNATDFTAAWSAVSNATSYRLDVATHATFSGGGGLSEQVVLASNGATAASVNQDGWSAVDTGGSTYAQMLKSTSTITTPAFSTVGLTNLTVHTRARTYGGATGSSSNITISISTDNGVNWVTMGVVSAWVNTMQTLPTLTNTANLGHSQTKIRWQTLGATGSIGVDVTNLVVQGWTEGAGAPSYISGYSNRTVTVTSESVTGLVAQSTYYFRVRAVNNGGSSGNSATGQVTTTSADPFEQWLVEQGQNPQNPDFAPDADMDGDGMTTWEEYQAGTDPADASSLLKLEGEFSVTADELRYTFPAHTGRYYQLIYATNLAGPFVTSNLGWGVPGIVITNDATGDWFGGVRAWTEQPSP